MTLQDFKIISGVFVVMLCFGLLYTFNMSEPIHEENVHSNENVMNTNNIATYSTEHEANALVSESTKDDEDSIIKNDNRAGFISSGTIINRVNYDVSSNN